MTLVPYITPEIKHLPQKQTKILDANKLPISLNQGKPGKLIVTDVKYKKGKTLVFFKDEIKFPYLYIFPGNNIWLKDSEGLEISPEKTTPLGEGNLYVSEFITVKDNEKPMKVVTRIYPMPEIINELKIKIPIKND
ncbi:hypothetical protein DCC39_08680 [Pueribacillus theae]|uniref:Uncharacterized protein n=1 Tax=Pueribacillus theae TaxID=2171751 RepID=A0A2U1K3N0_9BACI|nr:hypothetical protein [Pueribacillus theae]PWA11855.1 hypothetical protein DCC39_08680 [Pueribacillus theae]